MEQHVEKYKVREALFKQVDKILKENGIYEIDYTEDCATLHYAYPEPDCLYTVLNGDTLRFFIPANSNDSSLFRLQIGDTLIFEEEDDDKVWFTCPKYLIGREADDMDEGIGFTEHNSLSEMIKNGLIGNEFVEMNELVEIAPSKPVIKKTIPRIRTSKKEPDPDYSVYDPGESTIKRAKKLFEKMKNALSDITNVSFYVSRYNKECIRTLKISQVHYPTSQRNYNSAAYIRLSGRWLEKVGFQIGDSIQIVAINGMLLIVPVTLPFNPYEWEPE